MTPEQARALFNDHREPGDLAHYGEKAAVAAILAAVADIQLDIKHLIYAIDHDHFTDSLLTTSAFIEPLRAFAGNGQHPIPAMVEL